MLLCLTDVKLRLYRYFKAAVGSGLLIVLTIRCSLTYNVDVRMTSAWVFGSFFSHLRRAFLLLRQRFSRQNGETSGFSALRANFVLQHAARQLLVFTLTLMQGKLVMLSRERVNLFRFIFFEIICV